MIDMTKRAQTLITQFNLGTFTKQGEGWIRLEKVGDDYFIVNQRPGMYTPRRTKSEEQHILTQAKYCFANGYTFEPEYPRSLFAPFLDVKTGLPYREFTMTDWLESGDAPNIPKVVEIVPEIVNSEYISPMESLLSNWK